MVTQTPERAAGNVDQSRSEGSVVRRMVLFSTIMQFPFLSRLSYLPGPGPVPTPEYE
jgi:hypothetical protein